MNHLKELIIEDLDKLSTHELGKVYKFIRMELIAEIPNRNNPIHAKYCTYCEKIVDHVDETCQICGSRRIL